MSRDLIMLLKSVVAPFYRQYAALFAFLLYIMVFAVGTADGAGLLEYHLSLMKGILLNRSMQILVGAAWLLYGLKCQQFIERTLQGREFFYLYELDRLKANRVFACMLLTQLSLFLPVLLYAVAMSIVGLKFHWTGPAIALLVFAFSISIAGAARSYYLLRYPGAGRFFAWLRIPEVSAKPYYWKFLARFIVTERKVLFAGIKLYSAGTLFFLLSKSHFEDRADLQLVYLFYSFGLLGHGVLIHQLRKMEDERLEFYRSLPIRVFNRWLQYAILYLLIFIPEVVIIVRHQAVFPDPAGAPVMIIFGYAMLLLLNSILFIRHYKMSDYLKIVITIFFLVYIAVLTGVTGIFTAAVFFTSLYIFFTSYYQYERLQQNME